MVHLAILLSCQQVGCVCVCFGSKGLVVMENCLAAQGVYKGPPELKAFLVVLPLCNFVASPPAVSLSVKFEASILMAKMTWL